MHFALRLRALARLGFVLFLGGASSGCLGCAREPAPSDADALRLRFPDHAARILESPAPFAAAADEFAAGRPGLTVHLPAHAGDSARFELPAGTAIQVRELGVSGDGALAGAAVAYGREGGRSYWTATANAFEEWLLLDEGVATGEREVAAWDVEGGELALEGETVVVRDQAGTAQLRVAAPAAYAISGRPIPASLAVRGSRLELWADAGGEAALVDPTWTATGSLTTARFYHAAALLQSGEVVVAGGSGAGSLTFPLNAEIYNPATGMWSPAGTISNGRQKTAAVTLPGGKVLLAGGYDGTSSYTSADLYNPATNTWSATGAMSTSRSGPTLTLLASGLVLVTGGLNDATPQVFAANAELYNPATGMWSAAGTYGATGRRFHVAVLLPSGQVLLAGGMDLTDTLNDAWLYNPTTNAWTETGNMLTARTNAAAVLLPNGLVLVAGGSSDDETGLATTEIYTPSTGLFTAGQSMTTARMDHTMTLLPGGQVLVTGGDTLDVATTSTELYTPSTGMWTSAGAMITARAVHTATLLNGGSVLVAGGGAYEGSATALATSELLAGSGVLGATCQSGTECQSASCVDGVCCQSACNGGVCTACSIAAGSTANGTCTLLTGAACNDGNACTQTDTCKGGVCVGSNPVQCGAATQCETAGVCNPSSGLCVTAQDPNGTPCDDGNSCTTGDACLSGACTGTPTVCTPPDGCHTNGVCSTASGQCVFQLQPDGTSCSDGNVCQQNETCTNGVCGGGTALPCTALDGCHVAGVCDPVTGCSNPTAPDGMACSGGTPCTQDEVCLAGACVGGTPTTCPATNTCQTAGTCDPVNGCVNPSLPDGTTCNDNDACTQSDVCKSGMCTGFLPVVCPPATSECQEAGVCAPATGLCSNPPKPDGTPCSIGTCSGGTCTRNGGSGAGGSEQSDGGTELILARSGCGCSTAGEHESGEAWLGLALAAGLGLEGRRRRKSRGVLR